MVDPIEYTAHLQTDDYIGSVAVDSADFEGFHSILGFPDDDVIVGLTLGATHPSLGVEGKDRADGSYTHLDVYTINRVDLPTGGLPVLFGSGGEVGVVRTRVEMPDSVYSPAQPVDAFTLLQRAAKRLTVVLWTSSLVEAGLDAVGLRVVSERYRRMGSGGWVDGQS